MNAQEPRSGWGGSVLQLLASSTGGVGQHVASVTRGLLARGVPVVVAGPAATDEQFGFAAAGARFVPIEIPASPTPADARAVGALRGALTAQPVDLVHAHGLRAGLVAVLARPAVPLVVTWHNAVLAGGVRGRVSRLAERFVARSAPGHARCLRRPGGAGGAARRRRRPAGAGGRARAARAAPCSRRRPRRVRDPLRAAADPVGRTAAPAEAVRPARRRRRPVARAQPRPRRAGRRQRPQLPAARGAHLRRPRPGDPARAPHRRGRPARRRRPGRGHQRLGGAAAVRPGGAARRRAAGRHRRRRPARTGRRRGGAGPAGGRRRARRGRPGTARRPRTPRRARAARSGAGGRLAERGRHRRRADGPLRRDRTGRGRPAPPGTPGGADQAGEDRA